MESPRIITGESDEDVGERLLEVDWAAPAQTPDYDWRVFVPVEVRERWADIGALGRWAVYVLACDSAERGEGQ